MVSSAVKRGVLPVGSRHRLATFRSSGGSIRRQAPKSSPRSTRHSACRRGTTATPCAEPPLGDVSVARRLNQAPGAEELAPLAAALGLPAEHYGHDVRRIVADEISR